MYVDDGTFRFESHGCCWVTQGQARISDRFRLRVNTGCRAGYRGTEAPGLDVSHLPLSYKLVDEKVSPMLTECRGENVLQRSGEMVSTKLFKDEKAGEYVTVWVAKENDNQLFSQLADELRSCAPTTETDLATFVKTTTTMKIESGPAVGEADVYFSRSTTMDASLSDYTTDVKALLAQDPGAVPGVLLLSGGFVVEITGPLKGSAGSLHDLAQAAIG